MGADRGTLELNDELDGLAVDIGQMPPSTPVLPRRAILVAGSHRSGTSALARVLSLVGCDLPKHVMPQREDNEFGFWEPEPVVHAHDTFLTSIGSSWDDVAALPDGALVSSGARELRQQLALVLLEEYGTSPLFVVKDPRISRLLPLWLAVLAELQIAPVIAVAVRNPLEVAASLKAREGFTTTKSLLLWLRHMLESEQHSRGRARSIVLYDELLRNWQGVLTRVGEDLGVTWPGRSHRAAVEIENFLSEQHRHHVFDWRDVEGRADVVSWVKEAYFALRASGPVQVLDQVRDELAQADIAFGPILEEARLELQTSREQTLEVATARDALAEDVEARDLALETRAAEVQQLQEKVEELNSAIAELASQAAAHQAEVVALHAERDHLVHEVERIGAEANGLAAAVEAAQGRVDAADAGAASTREELNTAYAELDRLRTAADEAVSRAAVLGANLSAAREKLLTDLEAARASIEQLAGQVASANAALGALEAQAASDRGELLQELEQARADAEQLNARVLAAESEAAADRRQLLADLDTAKAEADRLAKQLENKSLEAEELISTADELLSIADAEVAASRADKDRLRAEVADKLEEQGQLLILVEHLEAALESATAALSEHEQAAAAAAARESAARRAEFDAERTRLLDELEAARTDLENDRSEIELVRSELRMLESGASDERAAFIAERDAARTGEERLVAELETERMHAERLSADTAKLQAALDAHKALVQSLQSVTKRRTLRRRSLSQFGTWLLPPTPRKLTYLRRYLSLRWSGEFDVDLYLLENPDVLAAGVNPLMHYAEYGVVEGRTAHARVSQGAGSSTAETREVQPAAQDQGKALQPSEEDQLDHDVDLILASDLFSPAQYQAQLTQAEIAAPADDPAELARHYLLRGERAGLVPSLLFDPDWYAAEYPDVLRHRSLLLHFIEFGDVEHRSPHPLFDPVFYTREGTSLIERPYAHFRAQPDAVSRAPHPMLDLRWFLDQRRRDAEAARDPFAAFLEDVTDDAFMAHVFQGQHYARELGEPYDPKRHNVVCYLKRIRTENVSAHPTFDAEFYLRTYPDVRAAGRHAYLHYLLQGQEEGRQGREAGAAAEGEQPLAPPMQPERDTSRTYDVTVLRPPLGTATPTPIVTMPVAEAAPSSIASREVTLRAEAAARFRLDRGAGAGRPQPGQPNISFLMPVFRPPLVYLDRAIRSVLQQSYGNWQLCIVDDASHDPAVTDLLRAYASSDVRISVAQADWNGGIAQATNAALAMARGEYVGLLDHDDMLTVQAVELVTERLLNEPDTDLVYSDECTLDTNDVPLAFFSKPDWSPFLLLSCMYTGHLSVYRRALVEKVGGFRSGYDFSQDYDLALRVAETNPHVQHLATCLYGWRSIPESAAQDGKPHARKTNIAALQDALDRRAMPASAGALPTSNRFVRHVSARTEFVSIIIPSDDLAKIDSAVLSIQRTTSYDPYEIIVVTNSRVRDQVNRSRLASAVRCVTYDKPFNFSDKCNAGARKARGNRLVFFNDDVEVLSEDWLEVLLDTISLDGVGAVAPRLVYGDGSVQHAGMVTGVRGLVGTAFHGLSSDNSENFGLPQYAREVSLLSGACLMVAADVFSVVGGFDPQNTPIDHSDVDLCLRICERGLRCVYTPFATLRHLGHQSLGEASDGERGARRGKEDLYLLKRWPDRIAYDPYFTPRMRDLHFRDSQETFMIFPGDRSATSEARRDVLLVSHDLSSSGAPMALVNLGRVLKEAGFYVCVCAPTDGPMRDEFAAEGIDVIVDELLLTANPSVLDFAAPFDFAIANTAVTWQFVGQVAGSVPVYWYLHESELISQLARENHDFVSALRAAAGIWAAGPLPARQLMELGAPVQTLTSGVDTTRMPGGLRRRSEGESVVVGVFGSYEPRKGQDLAVLGVLGMPPEARKKVRLELWGRVLDVSFARELRDLAAGCTQVYVGPELSPEQCLRHLADSDVVLVPSRDDPLPLVSLDALACSRILVVSRKTGTSEYVEHGVSAFILEENSPQEIAKTLTEIVQQGDLCPGVRAAGRAAFEAHFSWERFTAQVRHLLAPEMNQLQRSASGRVEERPPLAVARPVSRGE